MGAGLYISQEVQAGTGMNRFHTEEKYSTSNSLWLDVVIYNYYCCCYYYSQYSYEAEYNVFSNVLYRMLLD